MIILDTLKYASVIISRNLFNRFGCVLKQAT